MPHEHTSSRAGVEGSDHDHDHANKMVKMVMAMPVM